MYRAIKKIKLDGDEDLRACVLNEIELLVVRFVCMCLCLRRNMCVQLLGWCKRKYVSVSVCVCLCLCLCLCVLNEIELLVVRCLRLHLRLLAYAHREIGLLVVRCVNVYVCMFMFVCILARREFNHAHEGL